MKLKLFATALAGVMLGLSAPAFAQVIDKTVLNTDIAVSDELVSCYAIGSFTGSYINMGEPRTRISVALDSGELSWLPVLRHSLATLTEDGTVCPSLKEIVGEVSPEGRAAVTITRSFKKISNTTYGNCKNSRLDERIELKFSTGKVLTSRATHALGSDCNWLD